MLKICAVLILILSSFYVEAQSLSISNQSVIGSSGDDVLYIHPAPNNDGYFLIGESDGNSSFDKSEDSRGGYDIWLVKTDNNFVRQWDKTYGGDQDDYFQNAVIIDDKIIISSVSNSNTSGDKTMDLWGVPNIWNICLDLSGNILWQYQYGGAGGESRNDMLVLSDTSVLMAIETFSDISGNKTQNKYGGRDIWLVEAAINDGHIIQQNNIGSTGSEEFPKIVKSPTTGKIFMTTISGSGNVNYDKTDPGFLNNDVWLTEIDNNLNVVHDKCFGGDNLEDVPRIAIDNSDNIIIGAKSRSSVSGNKTTPLITTYFAGYDCWVVKVDVNFDIIWDKSYGGTQDQAILSMYTLSSGELVVNCTSFSNQNTGNKTSDYYGGQDGWVLFLDVNGNDILQESFGGSGGDAVFTTKHPTDLYKLILCSPSNSPISGNKTVAPKGNSDAWIGVLDYSTAGILSLSSKDGITAFPNPFTGSVSIQFKTLQEAAILSFITIDGKELESIELNEGTSSFTWNTKYQGIVFYALRGQNTQLQGKLISE